MKNWQDIYVPILQEKVMVELKEKVKKERAQRLVLPKSDEVLNAFKLCPFDKLKLIIVGQD